MLSNSWHFGHVAPATKRFLSFLLMYRLTKWLN
jgi:hypothetical protein